MIQIKQVYRITLKKNWAKPLNFMLKIFLEQCWTYWGGKCKNNEGLKGIPC